MEKPTDRDEQRRYCDTDGDLYQHDTPPPWDVPEGWMWRKTIFGTWFEREPNLPYCCDPSFERYWCM